jgi:phospholipase/carboxylesterase
MEQSETLNLKPQTKLPFMEKHKQIGEPLATADKVMLLVHGRGATAENILTLVPHLKTEKMAFIAPQATGGTWYPYSFLAPIEQNEPYLSAALEVLKNRVENLIQQGFQTKQIYLLGFSQGACLTLEFALRNPQEYGGIFGLSGGMIKTQTNYEGDFLQTPVFLGCSDTDFHIPKERVIETAEVFKQLNANVNLQLYPNAPHTVLEEEVAAIQTMMK